MRKLKNEELSRKTITEFKNSEKTPIILVLDNVRSLHNVGSIFRTADAFMLNSIYLCGITGKPPHREIEKTALGSTESVNWKYFASTVEAIGELKEKNIYTLAVEQAERSISLEKYNITQLPIALIFGNEVDGVAQEIIDLCDAVIEIPQIGTKHSLNIAVSAGIVTWHIFNKFITLPK